MDAVDISHSDFYGVAELAAFEANANSSYRPLATTLETWSGGTVRHRTAAASERPEHRAFILTKRSNAVATEEQTLMLAMVLLNSEREQIA
mmetsp:Transcript_103674/g.184201  ORF Transcript_103674/g.184201 Transcript_103674/m.184201 type:complete len:91 (-) Transcript_103674:6-278(-)